MALFPHLLNEWELKREIKKINRNPVVSKAMQINSPAAAVENVVKEAAELQDAFYHDPQRAITEAGDVFMSTRMAIQAMGYSSWASENTERWAIKRLALRWPVAFKILKNKGNLTWPEAWAAAKEQLSNAN